MCILNKLLILFIGIFILHGISAEESYVPEKVVFTLDSKSIPSIKEAIVCPSPAFPKDEDGNLIEGWVTLEFLIAIDGKPTSVRLIESSGNKTIEQHALKELKRHNYPDKIGEVITNKFNYEFTD